MHTEQAKSTDAFLAPTAKSLVPYGRTSPRAGRFYFCPALKRTKKVVSGAPMRAGDDLDSSPRFSLSPLLASSVPHSLGRIQTPSCSHWRQRERRHMVCCVTRAPLTSQDPGGLPVPKTLLSGERELGTDGAGRLEALGGTGEKLLSGDQFTQLTPLYRSVIKKKKKSEYSLNAL